jgi:hypothetical protein
LVSARTASVAASSSDAALVGKGVEASKPR